MYKWEITKDHTAEPEDKPGTNMNAVGLSHYNGCLHTSPWASYPALSAHSGDANKTAFKMYDDDDNLHYEGYLYGDFDGFEPLDDFGMPNAGATSIFLFENNKWQQV